MVNNELIRFSEVTVYRRDEPVFQNLNFQLKKGELMYIAGPKGKAGSLLLSAFYAHAELQGKEARVLNYDLLNISREEVTALRQQIGLVLNELFLYEEYTLQQNLEKFRDILSEFSQMEMKKEPAGWLKEFGLDPDKAANELTQDEKIMYSVAKAMYNMPNIIFIEDHFGNLELEDQVRIMDKLIDYVRQELCSVVMIQSNSDFIERYPGMIYNCECDSKVL